MTAEERPPIPESIKLAVRRKCKFGCIICGCPIYDYEHLVDYAIVQEHTEENIFLLCPTCHRKKEYQLSREEILYRYQTLAREQTFPELLYFKDANFYLGNNLINSFSFNDGYIFNILNRDYFRISHDDESFYMNAQFYTQTGKPSLIIENNQYTLFTDIWDINYEGGVLIFRNRPKDIFLKIFFQAEMHAITIHGKFYFDYNKYIDCNDKGIYCNRTLLATNCVLTGVCKAGFWVRDADNTHSFLGGPISALHNIANVESCGIVEFNVGFVWDKAFLKNLSKTSYRGGVKQIVLKGSVVS